MKLFPNLFRFRWNRFSFFLLLLPLFCAPITALAQFKFREPPNRQDPASLSQLEGEQIWEFFLANRNLGSFRLDGVLTYRPARAAADSYSFSLRGNWSENGQLTRLLLDGGNGRSCDTTILVEDGIAYSADSPPCPADGARTPLPEARLGQPFIDGLPFSWRDLLMPYLAWSDVRYLGPERYLGRPAHRFTLHNPQQDSFPASVVVTLDEDYAALLRISLLDASGATVQRVRVGGFRQFDGQWMFSELYWEDRSSRDSLRLDVDAFAAAP